MALTRPAGTWTYDDLLSLPDDGKRYEIIEGELHEMPAPSLIHQAVILNLVLLLAPVIQSLGGRFYFAPLDVFFNGADPVQPDLIVMLSDWTGTLRRRGPQGTPDLVIEILSPSNRTHDLLTKRALYGRAGVREYWIIDPDNRRVEVLTLDRDAMHTVQMASGDDVVASSVLDGSTFPLKAIFAGLDEIEPD